MTGDQEARTSLSALADAPADKWRALLDPIDGPTPDGIDAARAALQRALAERRVEKVLEHMRTAIGADERLATPDRRVALVATLAARGTARRDGEVRFDAAAVVELLRSA